MECLLSRPRLKHVLVLASFLSVLIFLQFWFYNSDSGESRFPGFSAIDPNIESHRPLRVPITIVTAASGNHACSLEAFLYSMNSTLSRLITLPEDDRLAREERIRVGREYIETSRDLESIREKSGRLAKPGTSSRKKNGNSDGDSTKRDISDRKLLLHEKEADRNTLPTLEGHEGLQTTIYEIRPRIVLYNMGMGPDNKKKRRLKALIEAGYMDEIIDFEFEKYPSFWRLGTDTRGEYGWKAGIIDEVSQRMMTNIAPSERLTVPRKPNVEIREDAMLNDTPSSQSPPSSSDALSIKPLYEPGILLWLDSGDRISLGFLRWLPNFLHRRGLWTPQSQDTFRTWTHPGLPEYYHDTLDRFQEDETNCNAAVIAFDVRNQTVRDGILKEWILCAKNKECIAPEGSSRKNHRQDQAALTYLVKTMGYGTELCRGMPDIFGVQVNRDRSCKEEIALNPDRVRSD
ncbi:hypothetical protein BGX28_008122 [Mortierella sp. GBA30]|nr:hypothetical protein BGX28_008122 [Mortierella sp. GBA30]